MLAAVRYNLSNLTRFSGRDGRRTFWLYVLFLLLLQFAVGLLAAIPMLVDMASTMFALVKSGAAADPDVTTTAVTQAVTDGMGTSLQLSVAMTVLLTVLIAAALVRRLHDFTRPGRLAIPIILLLVASLCVQIIFMDDTLRLLAEAMDTSQPALSQQAQRESQLYGLPGYLAYLGIIIIGCFKSHDGPNRYGEQPE